MRACWARRFSLHRNPSCVSSTSTSSAGGVAIGPERSEEALGSGVSEEDAPRLGVCADGVSSRLYGESDPLSWIDGAGVVLYGAAGG